MTEGRSTSSEYIFISVFLSHQSWLSSLLLRNSNVAKIDRFFSCQVSTLWRRSSTRRGCTGYTRRPMGSTWRPCPQSSTASTPDMSSSWTVASGSPRCVLWFLYYLLVGLTLSRWKQVFSLTNVFFPKNIFFLLPGIRQFVFYFSRTFLHILPLLFYISFCF